MNSLVVKIGLVELYTESFGNSQNPAILLISGSMCSGRFWNNDFCNLLANAGYFVIRYDQRDTGLSSAINFSKNPYAMNDLADDVLNILDAYKIDKAHILGASMGGLVAQILALDQPQRVLSLILAATAVFAPDNFNQQELEFLISQTGQWQNNKPTKIFDESIDGFLLAWQALHGDVAIDKDVATIYTKDMYARTRPEHLDWLEKLAKGLDPAHNHEIVLHNLVNRTSELANLKIPTLVMHGEKDCLFPPRIIQEGFVKHIPHAKVHVIPGMGHIVFNKNLFDKLGQMIIDFLKHKN